jgi:hypothetical protein
VSAVEINFGIEISPNNRRSCRRCGYTIRKGTIRVVYNSSYRHSRLYGFHISCFLESSAFLWLSDANKNMIRRGIAQLEGKDTGVYLNRVKKLREEIANFTSQEQGSPKTNLS